MSQRKGYSKLCFKSNMIPELEDSLELEAYER